MSGAAGSPRRARGGTLAAAEDEPASSASSIPSLGGGRVRLRPYRDGFSDEELRALYRWARDEELLALAGGRTLDLPYERFRELFLLQLPRHNTAHEQLFAVLDATGTLVGRAGLFRIDRRAGTAELGIVIGEREAWGRGLGREAVRLLADWALGPLGLGRVVLFTYPDNDRAIRAFEAAGFRRDGELRRFSFERGTHLELRMARGAPARA